MPLCALFSISVNELLSGKRIADEAYRKQAEETMLDLACDRTPPRVKVAATAVACTLQLAVVLTLVLLAGFLGLPVWARLLLIGAALCIRQLAGDRPYKIVIYGTPAEESLGGKIIMQENGCFQDIDIALMMHAAPDTCVDIKTMALENFRVTFHGREAHAAMNPEKGRSALDAILLSFHAIEMLREHVLEDTRMHYTVLDAGGPANVVPGKATAEYTLRSYNTSYLAQVVERFKKIIEGAALMTETTYTMERDPAYSAKIPCLKLNELIMDNARAFEAPHLAPPREKTGSTDFGNVMYELPGSCIRMAFVPSGTPAHSQAYLDAGKSDDAHRAVRLTARQRRRQNGTCT